MFSSFVALSVFVSDTKRPQCAQLTPHKANTCSLGQMWRLSFPLFLFSLNAFSFFPPCHWWNPHSVSWCLGPVARDTVAPCQLRWFTKMGIMDSAINSCIYYTLMCLFFFFFICISSVQSCQPVKPTNVQPGSDCARRGWLIKFSVLACSLNTQETAIPKTPIKNCGAVIHATFIDSQRFDSH